MSLMKHDFTFYTDNTGIAEQNFTLNGLLTVYMMLFCCIEDLWVPFAFCLLTENS